MNILELLNHPFTDNEKYIASVANKILDTFVNSVAQYRFTCARFYSESSNDPKGYRVIYVKNEGYTLVNGDGDRGMGWIVDGTSITENINAKFLKKILDEDADCTLEEIGFISDFEAFVDYVFAKVLRKAFTSADVFGNHSVKRLLDYNMDIRDM